MYRPLRIFIFLALFCPVVHGSEPLHIAVASNFAPTLAVLAEQYEKKAGTELKLIAGSTGKHYAQIRNGAPFDAFFAADQKRPELLEALGYGLPGSRFTYARGRLVLWGRSLDRTRSLEEILGKAGDGYLAIANPSLAPYGVAAKQTLEALGIWDELGGRLVMGENIAQTFQFVYSGNAQLGFVAQSQLVSSSTDAAHWIRVPSAYHHAIEQQAMALSESAIEFIEFVRSAEARKLIMDDGYDLP